MQIPPELDALELDPFEPMDALDHLMSFEFGPPAQELQLLHFCKLEIIHLHTDTEQRIVELLTKSAPSSSSSRPSSLQSFC
ncbi:hypothetical protein TNCV_880431 [Trichonephila clavipes]|nr:hypothetical protein TNCV_880431 [Trichonephila clavipes]